MIQIPYKQVQSYYDLTRRNSLSTNDEEDEFKAGVTYATEWFNDILVEFTKFINNKYPIQ